MTVESFALVLQAEMEADQSTALVDDILKKARAQLKKGNGTVGAITASGVNGKSFQRTVTLDCIQVIDACRRALKAYLNDGEDDDTVSSTYADFRSLNA